MAEFKIRVIVSVELNAEKLKHLVKQAGPGRSGCGRDIHPLKTPSVTQWSLPLPFPPKYCALNISAAPGFCESSVQSQKGRLIEESIDCKAFSYPSMNFLCQGKNAGTFG